MIKVEVKTPQVSQFSAKWRAVAEATLHALGEFARDRILAEARKKLTSTFLDYEHGLNTPTSVVHEPGSVTIRLVGKSANALERGYGPFDMKPGMLASARKRTKSGAPYMDVPFRHGTPGSTVLPPMPAGVAADMAKAVKRVGSLANKQNVQLQKRTAGGGEKAHHKVGVYDQLTRIPKTYQKATQPQYKTFRRVSAKSAAEAWKHPGYEGVKAFEAVARTVQAEAPKVLSYYAKQMGV